MFRKLFGFKPQETAKPLTDTQAAALVEAIRERSKEAPLAGAKLGSNKELPAKGQSVIAPNLALTVFMESAIP